MVLIAEMGSKNGDPMAAAGIRGAATSGVEEEFAEARISVWWDIENCAVPRGSDAYRIAQNIKSALASAGYNGPLVDVKAYGDTSKISQSVQQALSSTGVSLNHVPDGVKDASDKKILVDMIFWAIDNPPPANYLLISGDRDFSYALHRLRMKRYNILLAHAPNVSEALVAAAKVTWKWKNLVAGKSPSPERSSTSLISSNGSLSSSEKLGKSISDAGQITLPRDPPPNLHLANSNISNNGKDDNRPKWKEVKRISNQGQESSSIEKRVTKSKQSSSASPEKLAKSISDAGRMTTLPLANSNMSNNEKDGNLLKLKEVKRPSNQDQESYSTEELVTEFKRSSSLSQGVVNDSNPQENCGGELNQLTFSTTSDSVTQEVSHLTNIIHSSAALSPPLKPPHKEGPHFFQANKVAPSARPLSGSNIPNSNSPMNNERHLPKDCIQQYPRLLMPSDLLQAQHNILPGNLSLNSQKFSSHIPTARPNVQPLSPSARPDAQLFTSSARPDAQLFTSSARPDVQPFAPSARPNVQPFTPFARPNVQPFPPSARPDAQLFISSARPNVQPFTANQNSLGGPPFPMDSPRSQSDTSRHHVSEHSSNRPSGYNNSYLQQNPNSGMTFVPGYPNDPSNMQRPSPEYSQKLAVTNGMDSRMSNAGPQNMMRNTALHADAEVLIVKILNALNLLKAEKLAPTEANIADCICYGSMNIKNFNVKLALEFSIQNQVVVMHKLGDNLPFFIIKNDMLWKCVNIMDSTSKHPKSTWDALFRFLNSKKGCSLFVASQCRYHAATILKDRCLQNLVLGDVLQILHIIITVKKWIIPHSSGWQPLSLNLTGSDKN